ncbi:CBS domain-containing protein [Cnuella takakiae]|uniref:CBS domain-containing protein n=1 Tax=Cnuella takakiae TaxID=1302690 RepID=A0A1M4V3R0_9BACT|nr:CBS domain-containing protein [Cnuella takakiae]OLY92716.1 hypothetical protein BUE76_13070 [Cnuella takakiae]SHE63621.1 CBS domain-containing protein [Cnuella takakiae]
MESLSNILDRKYPQFNTVTPQHSLRDALYQMCCENLEYLVVLEGNDFIGLLSEQDVTHKLFAGNKPIDELAVSDIMNCSLPVAESKDTIEWAMQVLSQYNSRYLAIFDQFEFKGIVSEKDLMKQTLNNRNRLAMESLAEESFNKSY